MHKLWSWQEAWRVLMAGGMRSAHDRRHEECSWQEAWRMLMAGGIHGPLSRPQLLPSEHNYYNDRILINLLFHNILYYANLWSRAPRGASLTWLPELWEVPRSHHPQSCERCHSRTTPRVVRTWLPELWELRLSSDSQCCERCLSQVTPRVVRGATFTWLRVVRGASLTKLPALWEVPLSGESRSCEMYNSGDSQSCERCLSHMTPRPVRGSHTLLSRESR